MKQRDEMAKLSELGDLPAASARAPLRSAEAAPKTAVGRMFHEVAANRDQEAELNRLRARSAEQVGSSPTRRLDPKRIRASQFKNRHDDHFLTAAFDGFKQEVGSSGGNTVPIRVRRLAGEGAHDYEIVYGHRRHRACLELGIDVLAEIVEVDDAGLFEAMTRENVGREDVSPYDWGWHFKRALDAGLYRTATQMAAANNRSEGFVSLALQLAELPQEVVQAFRSPLDLQLKWGAELNRRLRDDRQAMLAAANELAQRQPRPSSSEAYALLTEAPQARVVEIKRNGKLAASIQGKDGVVTVRFAKGAVATSKVNQLKKLINEFLDGGDA